MSSLVPIFPGKVESGKLIPYDRDGLADWIKTLDGKPVEIIIRREVNRRSNKQNSYLWSVVYKTICDSLGWDDEDCHEFCKRQFNKKRVEIADKVTGEITQQEIPGSTKKLTTIGFMEYVEKIQIFFAEHGVIIPDPNQSEFIEEL